MDESVFTDVGIETERLVIRPYRLDDDEQLYRLVSCPDVMTYLPEEVMTMDQVHRILAWLQDCYPRNRPDKIIKWTLAAVWKETNQVAGSVGLGPLDFHPVETEMFYAFHPDYWGKGVATEAARAILKYAYEVIKLDRLVAVSVPANVASVKIIEKLGMRFEKVITGLTGEFADYEGDRYYSMTRSEYEKSPLAST